MNFWWENMIFQIELKSKKILPLLEVMENSAGWRILLGGENLRKSDFDHFNYTQKLKQHSVNNEHLFICCLVGEE